MLIAKVGLDGHEVGARVIARGLVAAGMEVVYSGIRRTPEQVVAEALQEDVDVIGVSILSGAHVPLLTRVSELMRVQHLEDVLLIAGGIIPEQDLPMLRSIGVDSVFHAGTRIEDVAIYIRHNVRKAMVEADEAINGSEG